MGNGQRFSLAGIPKSPRRQYPQRPPLLPRVGPPLETMHTPSAERSFNESKKTANDKNDFGNNGGLERSLRFIPRIIHIHIPLRQARGLFRAPAPGYATYAFATFHPLSESESAELTLDIEFGSGGQRVIGIKMMWRMRWRKVCCAAYI